jgi:signal transduction histidine kinase
MSLLSLFKKWRRLRRFSFKNRLFAPLYVSCLLLVLLLILQGCLNLFVETLHQQAFAWVTHSLLVEQETERLLSHALDQQTSIRGYLITKDKELLDNYDRANNAFRSNFKSLQTLLKGDRDQSDRLQALASIHDIWQDSFVQGVLASTASKTYLPGKILFDPMRDIVKTMLQHEQRILKQRQQQLQQINFIKAALEIFNVILASVGVSWNLWLLRQRVEFPLRHLTKVSQAWRAGKMEVRLNYNASDEIGRLASVLDAMAAEICQRQENSQMRNQQLEDLISALSHDLRTPLLATRNTLRPMLNGAFGAVDETWREVLEEYRQANEQLLKLVDNLLDVSRYEAGGGQHLSWEPLDWENICCQAVARVCQIQERQCTANIYTHIAPALPTIYGDQLEIQRVVQNLLDNAVRVSPPDEAIRIEVCLLGSDRVKVSVCDRGPGVPPQEKEKLFHRFIQGRGRRGGAGLGLYLCRQIVVAHGGTIKVDSQLGEGSTFWFALPVLSGSGGKSLGAHGCAPVQES